MLIAGGRAAARCRRHPAPHLGYQPAPDSALRLSPKVLVTALAGAPELSAILAGPSFSGIVSRWLQLALRRCRVFSAGASAALIALRSIAVAVPLGVAAGHRVVDGRFAQLRRVSPGAHSCARYHRSCFGRSSGTAAREALQHQPARATVRHPRACRRRRSLLYDMLLLSARPGGESRFARW